MRLGEQDVFLPDNNTRDYAVDSIYRHEKFNRKTFDSDIGLLRLKERVELSEYIQPICLPPVDLDLTNRRTYVTGEFVSRISLR